MADTEILATLVQLLAQANTLGALGHFHDLLTAAEAADRVHPESAQWMRRDAKRRSQRLLASQNWRGAWVVVEVDEELTLDEDRWAVVRPWANVRRWDFDAVTRAEVCGRLAGSFKVRELAEELRRALATNKVPRGTTPEGFAHEACRIRCHGELLGTVATERLGHLLLSRLRPRHLRALAKHQQDVAAWYARELVEQMTAQPAIAEVAVIVRRAGLGKYDLEAAAQAAEELQAAKLAELARPAVAS